MARRLFTIEDSFEIRNRGLVVVPGIIPEGDERFRVGDRLVLRKPDGSSVDSRIGGLERFIPNLRHDVVILLKELTKEDAPIGTEVWSEDADLSGQDGGTVPISGIPA